MVLTSKSDFIGPPLDEFIQWPSELVQPLLREKAVVFSPGGSTRWYFLEHGDHLEGYDDKARFEDYARKTFEQIIRVANLTFDDGIQTVLIVTMTPKGVQRDERYGANLSSSFEFMIDVAAQAAYEKYEIGVAFRGGWQHMLEDIGAGAFFDRFAEIERMTVSGRDRLLIWCVDDDPVPASLIPFVLEHMSNTGQGPSWEALNERYYGRRIQADIFIGNNKPGLESQIPPFLALKDVYFTVAPSFYLDIEQWRHILYDHLFVRPQTVASITLESSDGMVLGVGQRHEGTQTWRPVASPILPGIVE